MSACLIKILLLFTVFLISVLSVHYIRLICFKYNILDQPNHRSSHSKAKALMGGAGIILAYYIGLLTFTGLKVIPYSIYDYLLYFFPFLVGAFGFYDDIKQSSAKTRLILQSIISILSIFLLIFFIIKTTFLSFWLFSLGIIGFFWIIGNINSYNFMDGIDGIAAGCGIIFSFSFMLIGKQLDIAFITYAAMLLIPAQLGFLLFNFPPAKIFMGDVGSTFLGYMFALFAFIIALNYPTYLLIGPVVLLPFLTDTGLTLVERAIKNKKIFDAHREHLYQKLLIQNNSHLIASLTYYCLSLISGGFAYLSLKLNLQIGFAIIFIAFYLSIYIIVKHFFLKKTA